MSSENVAVVQGIYDAFGSGDMPAVLGAMSGDIVWNEANNFPYADNSPYVGPEAILNGVFMRCATEWDGFGVEVDEIIDGGDDVKTQLAHVWRIEDGKAVRFQQYADTLHVAHVTGLGI